MKKLVLILLLFTFSNAINAQIEQGKTGAWYMYFFKHQFKNSQFGIQGDVQYRNWNLGGDLEQLLIRSGITYKPKSADVLLTLGYGNITTGEFGDGSSTVSESRIYQEALFPQKLGKRFHLAHRFRYEQRFVENQDFRTRYRYNLFLNIPLNSDSISAKTIYMALYNELFINGQTDIGDNRMVELFDRNRTYLGFGYVLKPAMKFQLGWMNQKTVNWGKGQLQLSFHHSF
ncbi:DUF2490 domain-containing protein [Algibacter marinivivus]|uniref:DUF2490 domain-containing protein n=1 Tax=Algibacter marinivivus TaxID=2100723 RepID=A0A2U2X3Z2_9FLAO|nr:DUF2490 domain-containing protein [Algibacter marinivivus]PWH82479.1 DUF2490 domain-containing protein [Algibacter marinivivus]